MQTYSSDPKLPLRFWPRVAKASSDACWHWQGTVDKRGYGAVAAKHFVGRLGWKLHRAHRVAYALTFGGVPEDLAVLHRCDNPPCCNPAHLFLGTIADNNRDMREKGRGYHLGPKKQNGEQNDSAKLTENDVRAMRAMYAAGGVTYQDVADRFHVANAQAWRVVNRQRWAHI